MDKKTVVITEQDGAYKIENNGISEFALLGILECIVFDLKTAGREKPGDEQIERAEPTAETKQITQPPDKKIQEPVREIVQPSNSPGLRTRINNAVKAIKDLGGEAEDTDRGSATDEELKFELEELTSQYKRLKNSKNSLKK